MQLCFYCHEPCPPDEIRPYGPGGAMVCHPCANATPERKAETKRNIGARMDAIKGDMLLDPDRGFVPLTEENIAAVVRKAKSQ